MTDKPDFVLSTYIRCTRDALWDALTRADAVTRYHFAGIAAEGDLLGPGDVQRHRAGGRRVLTQTVTAAEPKSLLAVDFTPGWIDPPTTSRTRFLLATVGEAQRLTIEHHGHVEAHGVEDGWARFASNLKSWLETGEVAVGRMDAAPAR